MFYSKFRNCIIIVRKVKPISILSSSNNTPIKFLLCSNFQTILKTKFINRDFHTSGNNSNPLKPKLRKDQDAIDNENLQNLLKDSNYDKQYKLLQYEIEYLKQFGESIPTEIRPKDWIYLLQAPSKSQQRKYLRFLFLNEKKRESGKIKKNLKKEQSIEKWTEKQTTFTSGLKYGLGNNSLFLRFYDKTMDKYLNYNMILSMLYESKIVFDCSYEENMTELELNNCAKQLLISFTANRMHMSPSHLYLCNASKESKLMRKFSSLLPNLYEDYFPLDITHNSYLDIFDKNKLVYLTPHCRKPMTHYDPDKIYIIGAIVDKGGSKPYSLAKAKKEKLYMEQLPLDQYLSWTAGSGKNLALNQVLSILIDMKVLKNWDTVLRKHVPSRKLVRACNTEKIIEE